MKDTGHWQQTEKMEPYWGEGAEATVMMVVKLSASALNVENSKSQVHCLHSHSTAVAWT